MTVTGRPAGPGEQPVPELLTGSDAGDILQAAVGAAGGQLVSWQANQVDHRPRSGSSAAYRVKVRWPDGTVSEERFGAYTGQPPPGAMVVGDGAEQVTVWRFPHDPFLPGLAAAYDRTAVARLLGSFGVADGPVRLAVRAYRPRRRAVVEATAADGGKLFLKVVRPDRVVDLHQRHRTFTEAGVPSPPSLGYTPDGLLVLSALPGVTMRQALRNRGVAVPTGAAILGLLDRLPAQLATASPRRSWRDRAGQFARTVAGILPEAAEPAQALAAAITAEAGVGPIVPVHGDFYENQLRLTGGQISGLLDIDTAGAGDRIDDLACLLGHLSVLTRLAPGRAAAVSRLGARYLATFEKTVDPADLRYRIAAVVLSLAPGPYRVQEADWQRATRYRLELAQRWLDSARAQARR